MKQRSSAKKDPPGFARLLCVIISKEFGGAEHYAEIVGTGASARGFDVSFAFPFAPGMLALSSRLQGAGHLCFDLNPLRFQSMMPLKILCRILGYLRLFGALIRQNPRVVHITLHGPAKGLPAILFCAVLRIPTVVCFQLACRPFRLLSIQRLAYSWARKRNQRWIAVSEQNRGVLSKSFGILKDEIALIHNGANPAAFTRTLGEGARSASRSEVRNALGISVNAHMILTVGRLEERKGYVELLDAARDVVESVENVKFVWVGDGPLRKILAAKIESYCLSSSVLLLGKREDVSSLLMAADLFSFPTRGEGCSFAVIEAIAAGVPVITTTECGLVPVLENQRDGLFLSGGGAKPLGESLKWALTHPAEMRIMAMNATARFGEFRSEKMVDETVKVFRAMIVRRT